MSGEAQRAASNRGWRRERRGPAGGEAKGGAGFAKRRGGGGVNRAWPVMLLALLSVVPVFASEPRGHNIADAYINPRGNVVVVGKDGRVTMVTSRGGCERIVVAKDGRTLAWSKSTRRGSAVFVYRDGVVRKIDGTPFVRDYWFVDGGRKIGVASGGFYYAGWESLYDAATMKLIDEFNQYTTPAESRPWWSTSSEVFNGD